MTPSVTYTHPSDYAPPVPYETFAKTLSTACNYQNLCVDLEQRCRDQAEIIEMFCEDAQHMNHTKMANEALTQAANRSMEIAKKIDEQRSKTLDRTCLVADPANRIAELEAEVAALKPWAATSAATLGALAGKRMAELEEQNKQLLEALKEVKANAGSPEAIYNIARAAISAAEGKK